MKKRVSIKKIKSNIDMTKLQGVDVFEVQGRRVVRVMNRIYIDGYHIRPAA